MSDPGGLPPQSEQPPGLAAATLNLSWCQKKIDEAEALLKEHKEALKKLNAGLFHKLLEDDYKGWLRREKLPRNKPLESLDETALENWISYATAELKEEITELKEKVKCIMEEKKSINRQLEAAQEAALRQTKQNMPGPSHEPTTPPQPANPEIALAEFVDWAKGKEPSFPGDLRAKRIGRQGFDKAIWNEVKHVMNSETFSMQDSRALVLIGGSGIGKTFATLTAGKGQERIGNKDKFTLITLYIGFNCRFGLTQYELEVLEGCDLCSFNALLLLRLLASAASVLSHRDSLFEDDSDVQKIFCPDAKEWENQLCKFKDLKKLRLESIKMILGEVLEEVAIEGNRLVLLVAVDEAQELDNLRQAAPVPFQKVPSSRAALHLFRSLQCELLSKVLLLPIATGINPKLSLADQTKGKNVTIPPEAALISKKSLLAIVKSLVKDRPMQKWLEFFSELRWPRVRPLVKCPYKVSSQDSTIDLGETAEEEAAETLLKAGLEETHLDLEKIPRNCAVLLDASLKTAIPVVDYGVMGCLIFALNRKYNRLPWDGFNLHDLNPTSPYVFEEKAFRVLALYLSVFRSNGFLDRFGRTTANRELNVIGCGGVMNLRLAVALVNPYGATYPFDGRTTLDCSLDLVCKTGSLSSEVTDLMSEIQNPGDAVMMLCGGQAPIDFIVLTCTEKKKNGQCVLHADYVEAKARHKFYTRDAEEVIKKAKMVDCGMRRCLKEATHYVLDDTKPENHTLVMSRFPLQSKKFKDLRVIDPDTFIWNPFTAALYAMPQEEEVLEEEEEEGKGQKRERSEEEKEKEKEGEVPEEEEEVPQEEEEVPKKKKRRCKKSSKKSRKGPA